VSGNSSKSSGDLDPHGHVRLHRPPTPSPVDLLTESQAAKARIRARILEVASRLEERSRSRLQRAEERRVSLVESDETAMLGSND
jgi:hypothetical protein